MPALAYAAATAAWPETRWAEPDDMVMAAWPPEVVERVADRVRRIGLLDESALALGLLGAAATEPSSFPGEADDHVRPPVRRCSPRPSTSMAAERVGRIAPISSRGRDGAINMYAPSEPEVRDPGEGSGEITNAELWFFPIERMLAVVGMLRVCIYGGTDLKGMPATFVSALAEEILTSMPAVIVTGGFLSRSDHPEAVSTDSAALEGARRVSQRRSVDLETLFEAWVPEVRLDGRPDVGNVERMSPKHGVNVQVVAGRTALGRRLAMVGGVDVVITIAGRAHTEVVLEQAIEMGVPALPIPHAGGDSKEVYESYGDRIRAAFAPGEVERCFNMLTTLGLENPESIRSVVHVIRSARIGRCLVLQPYRGPEDELYSSVIQPAVEEHMQTIRLKDAGGSRQIYSSFFDAVANSTAIVADITDMNENVMYEVGYAHGRGLQPLLFTLDPLQADSLPIYFRTLNVHEVTKGDDLRVLINEYLREGKRRTTPEPFGRV